jgi:hypothetical protein
MAPLVGFGGETLTFSLVVDDTVVESAADTVFVVVENVNHAPISVAGNPQTVNEETVVWLDGDGSSDPDNDALSHAWTQLSGPYVPLSNPSDVATWFQAPRATGASVELVFELEVCDLEECDSDTVTITVLDTNAPPDCTLARASRPMLWPPNHKMVPVTVIGVTDPDDDSLSITVLHVTQDEPVDGTGSGDTAPDAVLQGDTVLLRAERAGGGNGRVYVIDFEVDDGQGGVCMGSITVCVPHGKRASSCPDDGQLYDATSS